MYENVPISTYNFRFAFKTGERQKDNDIIDTDAENITTIVFYIFVVRIATR